MRLRIILLILALLALLSASSGGFLYYSGLKRAAFQQAERESLERSELIQKNIAFFLSENIRPAGAMAGLAPFGGALARPAPDTLAPANGLLDHFRQSLGVEVCYLLDADGDTIASSNRAAPDSFVGQNFMFRPYVREALAGRPATYLALGTTSDKRGIYTSHPVRGDDPQTPMGLVVIKAAIDQIEREFRLDPSEIVFVTDPSTLIFISSREDWRYHTLSPLAPAVAEAIRKARQFGQGPWPLLGLRFPAENRARDERGVRYLWHRRELDHFPGWRLHYLRELDTISARVRAPMILMTGEIVLALCALIGVSVALLYREASREILRRANAEKALRESEERYRRIYHNAPAMLHSISPDGRLTRVSDHWLRVLGYERGEVIGRRLIDFLTMESGRLAETEVLPRFFRDGAVHDIPYRYVKKSGATIDTLLSALGERDDAGNIVSSLAVSVDITQRLRAEEDLKKAKEALSEYSRELERQVRIRTGEIAGILRYTPDVVSIKDLDGRYLTVNRRFEELFGVKGEEIRGKRAEEFMPEKLARELARSDLRVISENRAARTEHLVAQAEGPHAYLSVKFPIYDEDGRMSAVGSISTDITALKNAQRRLRRLSAGVIADQERERQAIARELHDELGQMLTALRMEAVWIRRRAANLDPAVAGRADDMRALIDQSIEGVRSIALRLRPGILDDLGLVDALEWCASDFERRTGIACIFAREGDDGADALDVVDGAAATAIYRIAQEALTNVARHARARRVDLALSIAGGRLRLTVTDDGCGFDPGAISETQGLGIAGMRERAALVDAVLEVRAMPGEGTQVCLRTRRPNGRADTPLSTDGYP